jgi:hypothetical protein
MKRLLRTASISLAGFLTVSVGGILYFGFQRPPYQPRPLPEGLTAIDSAKGQQLLAQSQFKADYQELEENFVSQARRAFCGVASAVMVVNALRDLHPPVNQSTFFTEPVRSVRSPLVVTFTGMNLAQLDGLLDARQVNSTMFYASDTNLETFRSFIKENFQNNNDFVVINYQREVLGQGKVGHISPIAAYNAQRDQVLILDVAAHKYPPVWVSTETLWKAMNTIDPTSNHFRGFVVVTP